MRGGEIALGGERSVAVYDRDGSYIGTITERLYGTFFIADWIARGRAIELDGTEGTWEYLIALLRREGYEVNERSERP